MSAQSIAASKQTMRLTFVGFCLSVLITATLAVYAYWISQRQVEASAWVDHTQQVVEKTTTVRLRLAEIRRVLRRYVITGDDADIANADDMSGRLKGEVEALRGLVADNPSQQARVANLAAAIDVLLAGERVITDSRRARGFSAAQKMIAAKATKPETDRVDAEIAGIEQRERELLQMRDADGQAIAHRFQIGVATLTVFIAAILGFLYSVIRRQQAAEQRLHTSEERFRIMAENVVDYGILMLDAAGNVTTWNPGAEKIKGYRAHEIVGRHFSVFYPPADVAQGKPQQELETAAATGSVRDEGWRVRKDGSQFWADVVITALRDDTGKVRAYAKLTRDLTERKRADEMLRSEMAERERIDADLKSLNESLAARVTARTAELQASNLQLQRSEARLGGILDSAMDAIITVDDAGNVILFNVAAEKIFNCPRALALGAPLSSFIPERFRAAHPGHVRNFGAADESSRRMGLQRIVTGLRRDGGEFPIDASISKISENGQNFYTVILRDVTRRVRTEEALRRSQDELRELAVIASTAREQEKSRIARELHDDIAQSLTAIKMDLSWMLERVAPEQAQLRAKIAATSAIVDSAVMSTRRISADLRPLVLDDLGLVPAVEWLVKNFQQRTGVECEFTADPPAFDVQEPHATAVFRILQESLTNVAKHAQASRVEVTLQAHATQIALHLRDNGRGFDPGLPRKPNSFGLAGLRERAHLVDAEFTIDTAPGRGTTIKVEIPLPTAPPIPPQSPGR